MSKERTPYTPTPGDYDTNKLTDIHSSESEPSSYARNLSQTPSELRTKNSYNSSDRSIKRENELNLTERIPTIIKYSHPDINKDDDKYDYQGEY
ncbi:MULTISPECIES: hypothetical protein [unclassified Clostridium]|uniref:hypothetical protein n=1 Tax=unclassified Clostridium TaxID=2614128 RepID=UPI00029771A3|nr:MULTISPECIES: hypothetical protein [unclassified Clostridium]EKQ57461.1 MAG: hypothetical protein A370_00834 [Clostridium sp. Maddingley MBC34-26]